MGDIIDLISWLNVVERLEIEKSVNNAKCKDLSHIIFKSTRQIISCLTGCCCIMVPCNCLILNVLIASRSLIIWCRR